MRHRTIAHHVEDPQKTLTGKGLVLSHEHSEIIAGESDETRGAGRVSPECLETPPRLSVVGHRGPGYLNLRLPELQGLHEEFGQATKKPSRGSS